MDGFRMADSRELIEWFDGYDTWRGFVHEFKIADETPDHFASSVVNASSCRVCGALVAQGKYERHIDWHKEE